MDEVVIYGAGGLGGLVQDILQQAGQYRPVAFLDSDLTKRGQRVNGLPVRGGAEQIDALLSAGVRRVIVAVGDNVARIALAETLQARGLQLTSAIHPLSSVSPSAHISPHVVIGPRATVCVHARIGPHTILSAGAIAEHDNVLGQGVFLHPAVRLAGSVTVEDLATIGIGASVIPGRRVGRGARVEPGSVVIRDVPPGAVVGGVPAGPQRMAGSRFVPG
jgi:sugar O-acyltransferase (sialic acid O-acetyltransferase NeuD family)